MAIEPNVRTVNSEQIDVSVLDHKRSLPLGTTRWTINSNITIPLLTFRLIKSLRNPICHCLTVRVTTTE